MDVTSLLNANATGSAGEQKAVNSRPTRSRTPWDAGGYSLPIMLSKPATIASPLTATPTSPPQPQVHHDDSQIESPPPSTHKFSDSRSSLSSFASTSTHSAAHSRFSSVSTVSGHYSSNSWGAELSPKSMVLDLPNIPNDLRSPSISNEPLDTLSTIVEQHTPPEHESRTQHGLYTPPRPSSPSDAILIKRTTIPTLKIDTSSQDISKPEPQEISRSFLSAPPENTYNSLSFPKSHRRATSAPDNFFMTQSSAKGPQGELTPPSSSHPDNDSPTTPVRYLVPQTPITPLNEASNHGDVLKKVANEHGIQCLFQKDCDTGSQLRKAISHIFGRNKMCTRLVPAQVWVHYCRKHYQRSRYRNPKEYAKLQCDLVQKQIRRIHDWSLHNQREGLPGVVQDWGLAIRKREQKRIDELSGAKRKRSAMMYDEEDGEDGSAPVPATAVPTWLLELCGKGYDTQSILSIFNRLHAEILADMMPQFPDIEILPNIATDGDDSPQTKGYAKRPVAGHKRSQSLGVGARPGFYSSENRSIPLRGWQGREDIESSPIQKRQRRHDGLEFGTDRTMPPLGARVPAAQRPMYSSIVEHHGEGQDLSPYGPLRQHRQQIAAPAPQRLGRLSMAANLEAHNVRRPSHQRSQSDMAGLHRGQEMFGGASYGSSSASPVGFSNAHYRPAPRNFTPPQLHRQLSQGFQAPSPHGGMAQVPRLPSIGHARHQSTPMPPFQSAALGSQRLPSYGRLPSLEATLPPVVQMAGSADASRLYHELR